MRLLLVLLFFTASAFALPTGVKVDQVIKKANAYDRDFEGKRTDSFSFGPNLNKISSNVVYGSNGKRFSSGRRRVGKRRYATRSSRKSFQSVVRQQNK